MKFYLFAILYLAIFAVSVYGLIAEQITLGENIVIKGAIKNTACWIGLLVVAAVPAIPIISAVYKALSNANGSSG